MSKRIAVLVYRYEDPRGRYRYQNVVFEFEVYEGDRPTYESVKEVGSRLDQKSGGRTLHKIHNIILFD